MASQAEKHQTARSPEAHQAMEDSMTGLRSLFMGLAVALAIGTGTAKADGLAVGVPFPGSWWVCDTEEQVSALDQAFKDGGVEAMKPIFEGFQQTKNDKGDPVCGGLRGIYMILEAYPSLVPEMDGQRRWVVKIRVAEDTFWSLYRGDLIGAPQSSFDSNPTPLQTNMGGQEI